jgi:hypothetical protein
MPNRRTTSAASSRDDGRAESGSQDPGAFIGRKPERATETIPGGLTRRDERVAAHSTRSDGVGGPRRSGRGSPPPTGHRQGPPATDDQVREAGENN